MLLISNNALDLDIIPPAGTIIRINTAWVNTVEALRTELSNIGNDFDIYLDYPIGRSKPPLPKMKLTDLITVVEEFENIKYFAWSNAENPEDIELARQAIPDRVILVPKIETLIGVLHLEDIVKAAKTNMIMIDKEDLATAAKTPELYQHFLDYTRNKAKQLGITAIELKGVIFAEV